MQSEKPTLMVAATKGHASTNVYTETISIRNNLLGILIPNEWEPTKSILAQVKSATYKNIQARKKQQAAANVGPED